MKLEDLNPKDAVFKINQFGDQEFTIRKFTLSDEIWLNQTFGTSLQEIFKSVDMDAISRIIFHQLAPDDKLVFQKQNVKLVNDDTGEVTEETIGGYRLLQKCIPGGVSGTIEKTVLLNALLETLGVSRPEPEKKSEMETLQSTPIGGQSSTVSATNMDGPPSIV